MLEDPAYFGERSPKVTLLGAEKKSLDPRAWNRQGTVSIWSHVILLDRPDRPDRSQFYPGDRDRRGRLSRPANSTLVFPYDRM